MDVQQRVREVIAEKLKVELSQVTDNANITNDLGADSLDTVDIIMDLEREFDVSIPDEETEKISTVADAIKVFQAIVDAKDAK